MNKQQAQQLIKDTFETTFDKGRFSRFVRNLVTVHGIFLSAVTPAAYGTA